MSPYTIPRAPKAMARVVRRLGLCPHQAEV